VSALFEVYGGLNAALMHHSKPSLKSSKSNAIDLSDFNVESPEDWACRFYWEAFFEERTHSNH